MKKYGQGEILPEPEDNAKTASKDWTAEKEEALQEENTDAGEGD